MTISKTVEEIINGDQDSFGLTKPLMDMAAQTDKIRSLLAADEAGSTASSAQRVGDHATAMAGQLWLSSLQFGAALWLAPAKLAEAWLAPADPATTSPAPDPSDQSSDAQAD